MRRLVDEVVADYDERSVGGRLPVLPDTGTAARAVFDAVAGFGPLQQYLDDRTVDEIWINEPGRVFVARRGRSELTTTILTEPQVRDLVEKMLKTSGRRVDLSSPFVDAMLPDGSRLHVVIPDITRRHWAVNISQVRAARELARRARRPGHPHRAGGAVPRRGRRGRLEHPGRRRHAGGQDHTAQLSDPDFAARFVVGPIP
ncbi:MAG TPA: hypothetical protein VKP89_12965 [Burkholderiales bacterium]|nr:hypothetical protein [Burkholderiales bacterium]